jgi:hypothetical protein
VTPGAKPMADEAGVVRLVDEPVDATVASRGSMVSQLEVV